MNLLFYLSIPIVVVIACWHLALAGRPPDLISLNSPTLAAAVAMTEIFFVITNRFKNNIQGVTSLANVECYGCPFSSMIHNTSKVVLTYQTLQMAHIIILFLSLTTLSLSLKFHMDARLMLIINPPSTIPLLLVILPLVVRSSTLVSSELLARRIVCTSSFQRRLRASSIRNSFNVSIRSSLATAVDASVSDRSSIDTDGFDRRRL